MWAGIWLGAPALDSDASTCPTAAEIWTFPMPNGQQARTALVQAAEMLTQPVQGPITVVEVLRILAAVAAGKTTILSLGGGQATVTFQAIDESGSVVVADMQDSERTNVTLTPNEST